MKTKELKKIITELGDDGKQKVADSLSITIRMIDYWLSGSVRIREVNAIAIRHLLEKHKKERACITIPIKD